MATIEDTKVPMRCTNAPTTKGPRNPAAGHEEQAAARQHDVRTSLEGAVNSGRTPLETCKGLRRPDSVVYVSAKQWWAVSCSRSFHAVVLQPNLSNAAAAPGPNPPMAAATALKILTPTPACLASRDSAA